ncbi:MAG: DegQ family serine endoprotease [Alphaproteobacteria bacterium]
MRIIQLTFVLCLSCVFTLSIPQASFAKEQSPPPAVNMIPASFADLAEVLSPAVVNISTTQKTTVPEDFPEMPQFPDGSPFEDFFEEFMQRRGHGMPAQPSSSLGSGFVIDAKNGYIVTNNHVVRDADDVRVTFPNELTLDAKIIGTDEKTDLAVLQIDTTDIDLASVSLGNSDKVRVGDWTLAIGNPFGLGGSVTAGIVSARARDIQSGPYDDYLQTDASINRGNSGGPLFDMNGKVIGINTAIFSPTGGSVGIGFAIPSSLAQPVISQIIKYGRTKRGWLGVRIQSVTDEIAESFDLEETQGALIASVNPKGPAHEAGLKAGDIILELGEQQIKTMKSLPRIVAEHDVGSDVQVTYWRDSKKHKTTVVIGELEKAEETGIISSTLKSQSTGLDIDSVGLTLKLLDDELRTELNIAKNIKGVLVSKVKPLSEAAKKGIVEGAVIVEINQKPVTDPQEILSIITKAKKNGRKSVLLLVNDTGNIRFIALRLNTD